MHRFDRSNERLRRHAADIDAGAADRALADQRDLRALFGGCDRGREPGRTGTDDDEVVGALAQLCATIAYDGNRRADPTVPQQSSAATAARRRR